MLRLSVLAILASIMASVALQVPLRASEVGMTSKIQVQEPQSEAVLQAVVAYSDYTGPVPESDTYGGFADLDGDGRKDMLVVVDNDLTCNDNVCDFFVFAPVVKDRQVTTACDWHLVESRRRSITREAGRRLVDVEGQAIVLTNLPRKMPCTLDGWDWQSYFHFEYREGQRTGSHLSRFAALTDICPGNASAKGT